MFYPKPFQITTLNYVHRWKDKIHLSKKDNTADSPRLACDLETAGWPI